MIASGFCGAVGVLAARKLWHMVFRSKQPAVMTNGERDYVMQMSKSHTEALHQMKAEARAFRNETRGLISDISQRISALENR